MFLLPAAAMSSIPTTSISIPDEAATGVSPEIARPLDRFSLSSLLAPLPSPHRHLPPPKAKKKRNQPGNPDPDAEVVALSPKTLMATNRFVCEICNKGFQRDQNLQLHRRGHNLPWKLRQKSSGGGKEGAAGGAPARKRVYVCPELSCVHHHPSRALGDLTGIKKHFSRKHGEKKWKCERCAKRYAVHSDWKAHVKACGTREYRCDCGTLFSRKDTFITHRAFCDALAEETTRLMSAAASPPLPHRPLLLSSNYNLDIFNAPPASPHLSATALLQRATAMGLLSFSNSLVTTGLGYGAPTSAPAGARGDAVIQYLHPTSAGGGARSMRGFIGGAGGDCELLSGFATGSGASSYAPMAGGPSRKRLAGFCPAAGTWS